jgi:hypothetical protein
MPTQLIIRHTVANFDTWKAAFDKDADNQQTAGLQLASLLRGLENDKDVTVIFNLGDVDKAKAFLSSDSLKQSMKAAGVTSTPNFYYGRSA